MKPIIDAKEARDNIRSGMSADSLMVTYNLSRKGLQSLLNKLVAAGALTTTEIDELMPEFMEAAVRSAGAASRPAPAAGKEVNAFDAVRDIRSGASNSDLMKKYGISPIGLENLFEQLVGQGLLLPSELQFRLSSLVSAIDVFRTATESAKKTARRTLHEAVWKCPACARPQPGEYEECPVCGVIVAKFKSKSEH